MRSRFDRSISVLGAPLLVAGALVLLGCPDKGGSSDAAGPSKGAAPASTEKGAATPPSPATTAVPTVAKPAASPNGRSAVPTVAEWAGVGEVTVKGSSALGCETKMIREWLRVSCHGKNDTGGTPTTVKLTKGGGHGDTFEFASGGVSSLVCPFVDGTDIQAEFAWSDKTKTLHVSWPHGAPMPEAKGSFQ